MFITEKKMKMLRERKGMKVFKTSRNTVVKQATDDHNAMWLRNSWRFLQALRGTKIAPEPVSFDGIGRVEMEFVEGNLYEPSREHANKVRYNTIHILWELQKYQIIHGDLTSANVIWRNYKPVGIDWDQSNFAFTGTRASKRPKPDIQHILPAAISYSGDPSRLLRRYQATREYTEYYYGWGSWVDFGTHHGEIPALAKIDEFKKVVGVDGEYIRRCIQTASNLWNGMGIEFYSYAMEDFISHVDHVNVISCYSTWIYLYNKDKEKALKFLRACIDKSDIFFFETQLFGDGPGNEDFSTLKDVKKLLMDCGATEVEDIISIDVDGRDAVRTTFKAT